MGNSLRSIMNNRPRFTNLTMPALDHSTAVVHLQPPEQPSWCLQPTQQNIFQTYSFREKKPVAVAAYDLPERVSVLSYNIWFESHNADIRYECILQMLEASKADFICLQEVTQGFMKLLHALPAAGWIGDYYMGVIPMGWYDTVILCKYRCRFVKVMFEGSGMGRSMHFAELLDRSGRNLVVGSMHYESLAGNQPHREAQIKAVQSICSSCARVVIAGDYNFTDGGQENKVIDADYADLWLKIHKGLHNSYTMPRTGRFAQWRPDHVMVKVPKEVELGTGRIEKIGEFTVPPFEGHRVSDIQKDGIVRSPSDHFGLMACIPLF